MTKKFPFSSVDRSLAARYLDKAVRFQADAEKMAELTDEFSGNGVAVLCVHAVIAYGDAVAIIAAGKKSKSGDHRDAGPFLASVVPVRTAEDRAALKAFQSVLNRKDEVSYAGHLVGDSDARAMLENLQTFARWAQRTFRDLRGRAPLVE